MIGGVSYYETRKSTKKALEQSERGLSLSQTQFRESMEAQAAMYRQGLVVSIIGIIIALASLVIPLVMM